MADNAFEVEQMGEIYAQALLNLARQNNALDEIAGDVHGIGELLKSNEGFGRLVAAVTISPEEHISTLTKIFAGRVHQFTLETLKSMARRSRLMFLRGLVEGWDALIKKESGHIDVEVITVAEMPTATLDRVRDAVGRATGKSAVMQSTLDPRILGGMKVRIGDTLIDASVESQLARMHEKIKRDGMAQIQKNTANVVGA